jgi:tRNA(adenine34) deaminase
MEKKFMQEALLEAHNAALIDEVPIGAVIVYQGKIIARGHNLREHSQNALDHAEMIAIDEACRKLGSWRLSECDLYVTIEPCLMCAGTIINARIRNVYYGAPDYKAGAVSSLYHLFEDQRLNHVVNSTGGIMSAECSLLMKDFFRQARQKRLKKKQHKG